MIEPIIYFSIGFLVAALIGLGIIPLVHGRAVRLTVKRLEASTPLSMAEIQADKDQLRAEFAMSARRLEISVEQLRARTTSQLAELGKKSDAINRLKFELGEKNATIFSLEAREKALKDQLRVTEEEFAARTAALREAEEALATKEAELARISSQFNDTAMTAESRQVELVALRAQVDELKARVSDAEQKFSATAQRLAEERDQSAAASRALADAQSKVNNLGERITDLEHQLIRQTRDAEIFASRVGDLEERLATQGRLLAERDYEAAQLRKELETAQITERDLRDALDDLSRNSAVEKLRAEKAALEAELQRAQEGRVKAQQDAAAIRQAQEESWTSERMENALLRERINDVAAEVARLAVTLEGPDSPIQTILAAEISAPAAKAASKTRGKSATATDAKDADGRNGRTGTAEASAPQGTLAERIKALQAHASRAPETT